jgi:Porin PorA
VNRAVMLRYAACGIIGLGAALLIAALLLWTYTSSRITKIPLDVDTTLISAGNGTALDSASLASDHLVVNQNLPLVSQQQVSVESPANADVVTLQVGTSVRRTDRQKDSGLLLAIIDTVTLNRKTAMAVSDDTHTGGSVQKPRAFGDENPPTAMPLRHDGLSYRFPFHTEKKTYPYFDPIAQKPFDVNYDSEEDVNGLTTYRFTQDVGYNPDGKLAAPVKYPSLYAGDEDGKVTASAAMWGVQGGDPAEQITMTRYYAAQRTFWVDPVSGTIVKQTEHANHYFARDPLKPEVTLADYHVTSTEDTVESQVNAARDERDRLALWSRVLPITFTAVGLISLVGGGLLASFSLRTESALTDPGLDRADQDFFGRSGLEEPVPGAEAETEKLPTQRPTARSDAAEPGSEGPTVASEEPPDSGPPKAAPAKPPDSSAGPPGRA